MPEIFHLVLNELSLDPPGTSRIEGAQRMDELREILDHVFAWVPELQQVLLVPESVTGLHLSEGYTVYDWLYDDEVPSINIDLRSRFLGLFTSGPYLDDMLPDLTSTQEATKVAHAGRYGLGLTLAYSRELPVVSAARGAPDSQIADLLPVERTGSRADAPDPRVRNFHRPASVNRQLTWLAERLLRASAGKWSIKPAYDHAFHHDPSSPQFRGRGTTTSELPSDAKEVYADAVMVQGDVYQWWGKSQSGYLYRYKAALVGGEYRAHWTGSTDPAANSSRVIRDAEIPQSIRDKFPGRRR